jgi:hypothetical protein
MNETEPGKNELVSFEFFSSRQLRRRLQFRLSRSREKCSLFIQFGDDYLTERVVFKLVCRHRKKLDSDGCAS